VLRFCELSFQHIALMRVECLVVSAAPRRLTDNFTRRTMTKTSRILSVAAILAAGIGLGSEARAQAPTAPATLGFVNINIGAQVATRDIAKSESLAVFGETATIKSSQSIHSGALFDISGGYRVWRNLSVAVGFSSFSKNSDAAVVATIPNPLVFDQPLTVTSTQAGLAHTEKGVHLQAVWFFPITDKIDVSISAGPSFISVHQELVSAVTIPSGTQNVNIAVGSEDKTAKGANVGVDGNYFFTRNFGAGVFIRYAGGSVDLPSAPNLKVGGFQIGVGARIRF
jgi:hypothetical protein